MTGHSGAGANDSEQPEQTPTEKSHKRASPGYWPYGEKQKVEAAIAQTEHFRPRETEHVLQGLFKLLHQTAYTREG